MSANINQSDMLGCAYFAGGCFWGLEHLMQQQEGVKSVVSGYMGGHADHPSYEQVCGKQSGHLEAVEVQYDPNLVSFTQLAKLFFELHDPTQDNGQGPDIGPQYLSAIFYQNDEQKQQAQSLIDQLRELGYDVKTQLREWAKFWPAEDYHQDYYARNGQTPYCHAYTKRFVD